MSKYTTPYKPFNVTPIPNLFIDEMMAELNTAEIRIMLYLFHHTYGFDRIVPIPTSQIQLACKVNYKAAKSALTSLEDRGYICTVTLRTGERGWYIHVREQDGIRIDDPLIDEMVYQDIMKGRC